MFRSQMLSHLLQDDSETTYEKLRNAKMPNRTEPMFCKILKLEWATQDLATVFIPRQELLINMYCLKHCC